MKQVIPPQRETPKNNHRANLFTVMHTGTTFWAQILKPLMAYRYRGFHQTHIIDRVPGIAKPGIVILAMRHPLATAISWQNRGRFQGGWSTDLTRSWGILCDLLADNWVLSVDAPHRDELLQDLLQAHDLEFQPDWSLLQNETKDWTKQQGMSSGEELRQAFREGDMDFVFSRINRKEYDRLYRMTQEHFPHYEPYVQEDWRDQRGSPLVASGENP